MDLLREQVSQQPAHRAGHVSLWVQAQTEMQVRYIGVWAIIRTVVLFFFCEVGFFIYSKI